MNFLEKDLEDLLWRAPIKCCDAGLDCFIDHACGCQVQRFRQPQFGPYGIGDILEITHATRNYGRTTVRVIECKRGVIGLDAYAQAKRYLTAAKAALAEFEAASALNGISIEWKSVLIGSHVDAFGDFLHVLNHDAGCEAYSYELIGQGIRFSRAGQAYLKHGDPLPSALAVVGKRVQMGAEQARAEVERIDAEMAIEFPRSYWDNLFNREA